MTFPCAPIATSPFHSPTPPGPWLYVPHRSDLGNDVQLATKHGNAAIDRSATFGEPCNFVHDHNVASGKQCVFKREGFSYECCCPKGRARLGPDELVDK